MTFCRTGASKILTEARHGGTVRINKISAPVEQAPILDTSDEHRRGNRLGVEQSWILRIDRLDSSRKSGKGHQHLGKSHAPMILAFRWLFVFPC